MNLQCRFTRTSRPSLKLLPPSVHAPDASPSPPSVTSPLSRSRTITTRAITILTSLRFKSNDSFGEDDDDEEDDDEDADEDGNLDGFVVPDKSESSESDSDGEPSVPDTKRRSVVVKRRTTPARD